MADDLYPIPHLTLEQMQDIIWKRTQTWHQNDKPWLDERWVTAITGELGEMANNVKKLFRAQDGCVGILKGETIDGLQSEIDREWADVMIYMLAYAAYRHIRPTAMIRAMFNAKSEQLGFEERM